LRVIRAHLDGFLHGNNRLLVKTLRKETGPQVRISHGRGFNLQGFLIFGRSVSKAALHVVNASEIAMAREAVGRQADNIDKCLLGFLIARSAKVEDAYSKAKVPILWVQVDRLLIKSLSLSPMFSHIFDIAETAMGTGIKRVDHQRLLKLCFCFISVSLFDQHTSQAHSVIGELPIKVHGLLSICESSIQQLLIAVRLILHQVSQAES